MRNPGFGAIGSLTTPANPCGVWRMVPLSISTDDEEDGAVGQYWEVQDGQKRQRKSLDVFKVEVAKVKDTEVKKGAGKSPRVLLSSSSLFPRIVWSTDDENRILCANRQGAERHPGGHELRLAAHHQKS